ncbi:Hypothetical predicted protein [Mytilus galloprovincialis]|uniref:Uncharacterized protein n=1 Tax=Mytilus galloprovincialis TaxID=29158 RepID=A0A8B6G1K6_MYTGA|nr:Hypothetical predicted protein [Mytilus galloprovincialis]
MKDISFEVYDTAILHENHSQSDFHTLKDQEFQDLEGTVKKHVLDIEVLVKFNHDDLGTDHNTNKHASQGDSCGGIINVVDTCKDDLGTDHNTNKHASKEGSCGGIINIVDTCKDDLGTDHNTNKHASQERSCGIINILKDASHNDKCGVVDINKDGSINDECEIIKKVDKEIQQLPSDIEGGVLQPVVFTAEPHVSEVSNSEDKSNLALTDNRQIMILRNDDMQESKVVLAEITENGMMRYIPVPDQDGATMFVLDPANTEHHLKTYHNQYDLLKGHAEKETIHIYTQQGLATACLPHGVETVTRHEGQETADVQQVLESADVHNVLESAGEQQVLESVDVQHCFENTTKAEKLDQDGFEPMEVTYSSMYSLSEMKSADNDI